jgi:hypothetical protein
MSRIRPSLPSPALVIALVALFVSLGGVAYGVATIGTSDIKNQAVTSKKIRNGTIRSRDVRRNSLGPRAIAEGKLRVGFAANAGSAGTANGLSHFAVVGANGVLARGRGLASNPVRTGEGRYQLIFNRDVRSCAYIATVGVIGATTPGAGEATTAALASNANGVLVRTFGSGGSPGDHSFHLIVAC